MMDYFGCCWSLLKICNKIIFKINFMILLLLFLFLNEEFTKYIKFKVCLTMNLRSVFNISNT